MMNAGPSGTWSDVPGAPLRQAFLCFFRLREYERYLLTQTFLSLEMNILVDWAMNFGKNVKNSLISMSFV